MKLKPGGSGFSHHTGLGVILGLIWSGPALEEWNRLWHDLI